MPHGEVYCGCRGLRVSDRRAMLHCGGNHARDVSRGDAMGVYHGVGHEGIWCEVVLWDISWGCCRHMWWEQLYGGTVEMCHGCAVREDPTAQRGISGLWSVLQGTLEPTTRPEKAALAHCTCLIPMMVIHALAPLLFLQPHP